MADSSLARRHQAMVDISIPVGYTLGLSPEDRQYRDALDPPDVLKQAQEWLVSIEQVRDFIKYSVFPLLLLTVVFFCIRTLISIMKYSRSTAIH